MEDKLNLFDVSAATPTDDWAYGKAGAEAWFTGALRTDDELDVSGEFDAQFSGQFGVDALKGLASLSGDMTGAVHAGVKLQAGMPLDLFDEAGILARLRLEASANVRAEVTAAMSAGELRSLVTSALPPEAQAYVGIVLDEIKVGATVWARASFAAMVISELVAAVELFPTDDTGPGITAYFHYGFGWGYGAGWGVITNVGFDLKRMLSRIAGQAKTDLHTALENFRTAQALPADDPRTLATQLAEVLLPVLIDALVSWCERELGSADAEAASLGDSLAQAVRSLLFDAILPQIVNFAAQKIIENIAHVPPDQATEIWGTLAAAGVYLAAASDDDPGAAIGTAVMALNAIAGFLRADVGEPLGSAIRCGAAIVVLATNSSDPNLGAVLATPPPSSTGQSPPTATGSSTTTGTSNLQLLAVFVLTNELTTLLTEQGLVPAWLSPLFQSVEAIVATLAADGSGSALTTDEAVDLLHSLLTTLETTMDDEGLWDQLATKTGFPAMIRSIKAQTRVVTELCASLKGGSAIDKRAMREAVSVAILMLIGQPIAEVIAATANRGLSQIPPALRALADTIDASDTAISIDASWDVLARQVVGSTVAFPVGQLLRHAAATAADWHDIRLPAELTMLNNFLKLDLADDFANVGPAAAVAKFKQQLLPILGQHVIDVVVTSHEFILQDSVNLFRDMVTGTVTEIRRSLEVAAIVAFRLVEEAIAAAEQAVSALQQREASLEQDAERYSVQFLTALSSVTDHIRGLDAYVGSEITDWLINECMGPAAANIPDWLRGALSAIVTAAVNISSGGILSALGAALGSIADLIDASAESLRLTAASPEGSVVGIQPLLEAFVQGDHLPQVVIPISVDVPDPFLPFIAPNIHIDITTVSIPAQALSSILVTIIFGSVGLAPLIETLNDTATSLRVTKSALDAVHDAIAGSSAQQMQQDLQAARPGKPLSVEIVTPQPAAVAPSSGTITFQIHGANLSFVDPVGAGLPQQAISRVQVNLNGQVVSVGDIKWQQTKDGIEGRLDYGPTDTTNRAMLRPGPAAVVVVVGDGYGKLSAQQAWHFIVESAPTTLQVVLPAWFPIAAGLITPVPPLERHGSVLGGPHRFVEAADLPVPSSTLKQVTRKGAAPATRWARTRPGVRVDEHADPALPTGYLRVAHLTDKAAAWCALDGRFGRIDWSTRQVHAWHTKVDGLVQMLRAGADAIAIGTAAHAWCFDAAHGKRLWSHALGKGQKLLDATHDVIVVTDGKSVIVSAPKDLSKHSHRSGELWSVPASGSAVAARASGKHLVLAETGRVRILALGSGEEEWHAKSSSEVVLAGDRLLVPEGSHTSLVYSLHDGAAKKLKTSVPLARPSAAGVRVADGTLIAVVTGTGAIVLVDLPDAVEANRTASTPRGGATGAWLAGPFLITAAPLSVTHLWGGVATAIPLTMGSTTDAFVTGPGQAIIRGPDRCVWLGFS